MITKALAAAVPGWLAGVIDASWQRVYGQRIEEMRLPDSAAKRADLAVQYARDGYWLLERAWSPQAPPAVRDLPAVRALRLILIQQFYRETRPGGAKVTWREDEHGLPPGRARIVSPYDRDARYGEKRGKGWPGYKAHYTETVSGPARDDPATGRPAHPDIVTGTQAHEAMTAARAGQATAAGKRRYAVRAGVEGLMAQVTHVTGIRRARYLGLPGPPWSTTSPQSPSTSSASTRGGPGRHWTETAPASSSDSIWPRHEPRINQQGPGRLKTLS